MRKIDSLLVALVCLLTAISTSVSAEETTQQGFDVEKAFKNISLQPRNTWLYMLDPESHGVNSYELTSSLPALNEEQTHDFHGKPALMRQSTSNRLINGQLVQQQVSAFYYDPKTLNFLGLKNITMNSEIVATTHYDKPRAVTTNSEGISFIGFYLPSDQQNKSETAHKRRVKAEERWSLTLQDSQQPSNNAKLCVTAKIRYSKENIGNSTDCYLINKQGDIKYIDSYMTVKTNKGPRSLVKFVSQLKVNQ